MALDGKIAMMEAVEQDVENRVHFALVLDDDPGRDLVIAPIRTSLFYSADEVEPIGGMRKPE